MLSLKKSVDPRGAPMIDQLMALSRPEESALYNNDVRTFVKFYSKDLNVMNKLRPHLKSDKHRRSFKKLIADGVKQMKKQTQKPDLKSLHKYLDSTAKDF